MLSGDACTRCGRADSERDDWGGCVRGKRNGLMALWLAHLPHCPCAGRFSGEAEAAGGAFGVEQREHGLGSQVA